MSGPLSDIRVLDFSTLLPGPMEMLFLSEAGAERVRLKPLLAEADVIAEEFRHNRKAWLLS